MTSAKLEANVPAELHDADNTWWALSTRLRVPVVSTERVDDGAVTSYEDLGDPQYKGRLCLRTSNNEYNQSLVADMIAKRGRDATEKLLRSWMANDPELLNSDGELLAVIAAGDCDIGLSNHYYLARALDEDPDFPVAPAWPDQDGAGAHTNVSGAGVVTWSDHKKARDRAPRVPHLAQGPGADRRPAASSPRTRRFLRPSTSRTGPTVKTDPIDVEHAGPLLADAIALMLEVGWT